MKSAKNGEAVMQVRTEWINIATDNYLRMIKLKGQSNLGMSCEIQFHEQSLNCDKISLQKSQTTLTQRIKISKCKKENTAAYSVCMKGNAVDITGTLSAKPLTFALSAK